jgi:transcriptional regulator with XRE-family HTH domain
MDRKTLVKDVASKLRKIREPLGYNHREMGELLSAQRSSYTRYEKGETFPREVALYRLGEKFDISLDWLILDRGPMYYKEKEAIKEEKKEEKKDTEPPAPGKTLPDDVLELVEVMEQVPILRYKVLLYFHELKKEHKEMIESPGKDKTENQ